MESESATKTLAAEVAPSAAPTDVAVSMTIGSRDEDTELDRRVARLEQVAQEYQALLEARRAASF